MVNQTNHVTQWGRHKYYKTNTERAPVILAEKVDSDFMLFLWGFMMTWILSLSLCPFLSLSLALLCL